MELSALETPLPPEAWRQQRLKSLQENVETFVMRMMQPDGVWPLDAAYTVAPADIEAFEAKAAAMAAALAGMLQAARIQPERLSAHHGWMRLVVDNTAA